MSNPNDVINMMSITKTVVLLHFNSDSCASLMLFSLGIVACYLQNYNPAMKIAKQSSLSVSGSVTISSYFEFID